MLRYSPHQVVKDRSGATEDLKVKYILRLIGSSDDRLARLENFGLETEAIIRKALANSRPEGIAMDGDARSLGGSGEVGEFGSSIVVPFVHSKRAAASHRRSLASDYESPLDGLPLPLFSSSKKLRHREVLEYPAYGVLGVAILRSRTRGVFTAGMAQEIARYGNFAAQAMHREAATAKVSKNSPVAVEQITQPAAEQLKLFADDAHDREQRDKQNLVATATGSWETYRRGNFKGQVFEAVVHGLEAPRSAQDAGRNFLWDARHAHDSMLKPGVGAVWLPRPWLSLRHASAPDRAKREALAVARMSDMVRPGRRGEFRSADLVALKRSDALRDTYRWEREVKSRIQIQHHAKGKDQAKPMRNVDSSEGYANMATNALRIITHTTTVRVYVKAWGPSALTAVGFETPLVPEVTRGYNCVCLTTFGQGAPAEWAPVFVPVGRGICGKLLDRERTPAMKHDLGEIAIKADQARHRTTLRTALHRFMLMLCITSFLYGFDSNVFRVCVRVCVCVAGRTTTRRSTFHGTASARATCSLLLCL